MADNQQPQAPKATYPPKPDQDRIDAYARYDLLQDGRHFDAFNITLENDLNKKWGHLQYVACNFAGLISKVMADMLFGTPVKFKAKKDDAQAYLEAISFENKLHMQNFESAMANSARGDAVFKLRVGKRHPDATVSSVIIEDISPYIYFPELDPSNMRADPLRETLAWPLCVGGKDYLRMEIHTPGHIHGEVWSYDARNHSLIAEVPWETVVTDPEDAQEVETKIDAIPVVHVPNWRKGTSHFGTSDYLDLEPLFFALNNRVTKIDAILDKHSDPILAVPEGVLDENGQVRKENMQVFEMPADGDNTKPEYIVWNANLDSAMKEIDKIVELLFMFSEVSPDTLGMGQGQAASGRALKLKMLRTIAKKRRKQMYYEQGLKEVMTIAQQLAKAWSVPAVIDGKQVNPPKAVETPEIEFSDGYVQDSFEAAQEEQIRLSSGTTTKKDAIMRLDGVDDKQAEETVKEIQDEEGLNLPLTSPNSNTTPPADGIPAAGASAGGPMPMQPGSPIAGPAAPLENAEGLKG